MSHYVYKYVLNDEIIYIGKTDAKRGLKSRLNAHAHSGDNIDSKYWGELKKATVYYCKLPNSVMADVVESELIRRYKPKCNKSKTSRWSGLDFVEPQWSLVYETIESSCLPKYAGIRTNMLNSVAYRKLNNRQKVLYMCCQIQSYASMNTICSDNCFYLNHQLLASQFGIYTTDMCKELYGDIKVLIEYGFIEKCCVDKFNRKSIYCLSDAWRKWSEGEEDRKSEKF